VWLWDRVGGACAWRPVRHSSGNARFSCWRGSGSSGYRDHCPIPEFRHIRLLAVLRKHIAPSPPRSRRAHRPARFLRRRTAVKHFLRTTLLPCGAKSSPVCTVGNAARGCDRGHTRDLRRRRQRRLGTPRVSDAGLRSRKKTISLRLLASELAHATDGFRLLPHSSLRGLLVEAPLFHLAKDALTLHPLLEDAQRLIHIVVAHENLQLALRSWLGFEDLLARFLRFTSHAGLRGAMSYLRWIPAPRPFPAPPAAATAAGGLRARRSHRARHRAAPDGHPRKRGDRVGRPWTAQGLLLAMSSACLMDRAPPPRRDARAPHLPPALFPRLN
jgi:hypothetical protein